MANIVARYRDIESAFPDECKGTVLPFFMDWLIERVQFVEISAYSDEDAYTIFETMNDRGLSLSPADMLKGYLLSNIREASGRETANGSWSKNIPPLDKLGKEATNDFFRTWFRGRYAMTAGTSADDYERLGPEFHRWIRDNHDAIGLKHSDDYQHFVTTDLPFYAEWYSFQARASQVFDKEFPTAYFNGTGEGGKDQGTLLLSCVAPGESKDEVLAKFQVVARFLDIFIARRIWAGKNLTRPALKGTFASLARAMRDMPLSDITARLFAELTKPGYDNFDSAPPLLTNSARRRIHRLLARITDYVETEGGSGEFTFSQMFVTSGKSRFDIEHIWPKDFKQFMDYFETEQEFDEYRNRLGALVLLPHSFNRSYQDKPTNEKIPLYSRPDHNLLVASLAGSTYGNNPRFNQWIEKTGFAFRAYDAPGDEFDRAAVDARTNLYRQLAKTIWAPEQLLRFSSLEDDEIRALAAALQDDIPDGDEGTPRKNFKVSVHDLILKGLITHGDILEGRREGRVSTATAIVLEDGALELENGETYAAVSKAAMSLFEGTVVNGWDFWIHQATGKSLKDLRATYLSRVGIPEEGDSNALF